MNRHVSTGDVILDFFKSPLIILGYFRGWWWHRDILGTRLKEPLRMHITARMNLVSLEYGSDLKKILNSDWQCYFNTTHLYVVLYFSSLESPDLVLGNPCLLVAAKDVDHLKSPVHSRRSSSRRKGTSLFDWKNHPRPLHAQE